MKSKIKKISNICFLFIVTILSINNTNSQNIDKEIDSLILNQFNDRNLPGGVFMVSKNGKEIYKKAFGKSNLELDITLNTENIFQIGSVTKQFTAISILMLEEQGKLKVTDQISKYIPDYPNGEKITIHHLLTHTSGIKDYTKMESLWDIAQKNMSSKELIDFFKNELTESLPGEKFQYNNSGYIILGHIIEVITNDTYENFIEQQIFEKIGMVNSYYANNDEIIKNKAYGYTKKDAVLYTKKNISYTIPFASGSIMSTASDLLIWQNALNNNLLISQKTFTKAVTKYKTNNGEESTYGYGWHIKDINGILTREHGGSIFGYKTMAVYIPSKDIYVVGLSNCDCNSPTQITKDIAKVALENL